MRKINHGRGVSVAWPRCSMSNAAMHHYVFITLFQRLILHAMTDFGVDPGGTAL
jgi:hypothetical protein